MKINTQLNIAFAVVLLVPMICAAVFSVVYFSQKITEEAVSKIHSDAKAADIIFHDSLTEMKHLAMAYAQKKTVVMLINFNLGEKIGTDLTKSAVTDHLDMITIIDASHKVLVRSHAPKCTGDHLIPKQYTDAALGGTPGCGAEIMSAEELEAEKFDVRNRLPSETAKALVMTGTAPIYDRQRENIVGVILVRRILYDGSGAVKRMRKVLNISAALFEHTRLLAWESFGRMRFVMPDTEILRKVLDRKEALHTVNMSRGGFVSISWPVNDFDSDPVGVLMLRTGVEEYLDSKNNAVMSLCCILGVGILLTLTIKTIVRRKLEASHAALRTEIQERTRAEERIRGLTRALIRAQEEERARIALDLHDNVLQDISAAILRHETIFGYDAKMKAQGKEITDLLRNIVMSVRMICHGLHPPELDRYGPVGSIGRLCDDITEQTDIATDFSCSGMREMKFFPETSVNMYRLVQEALNNIRKHSGASRASVRLIASHPLVIIIIDDNGRGFDMEEALDRASDERHMGIRGMQERVKLVRGKMTIRTSPGQGTKIVAELSAQKTMKNEK